jgi:catechol 2,3-dioxygenase-like lactoylglutathione lyase family enzyme
MAGAKPKGRPPTRGKRPGTYPGAIKTRTRDLQRIKTDDQKEVTMSTTALNTDTATQTPDVGTIDMKLEVVTLPVSDFNRAKAFYESLGWRLDSDVAFGDGRGAAQFTPLHSEASITVAKGITTNEPGSVQRLELIVSDIEAARKDLIRRGVQVSELFHRDGGSLLPGPDAQRRSYLTYASFNDPDGNGWLLQEVTERAPGRLWED